MKKYKLIKEYPGSPKLGTEIIKSIIYKYGAESYETYTIKGEGLFKISYPSIYPEFWQEVVEKDYEILSLIFNKKGNLIKKDTILTKNNNFENLLKNGCWSIYSVKRLSDGEIFTIGDKINEGIIFNFNIINEKIIINYNNHHVNFLTLKGCKKIKQPLFTTEDGVDIFEGDTFYYVKFKENRNSIGKPFEIITANRPGCIYEPQYEKYFSTKEKAEEYILMNKPCLSLNDLMIFFPEDYNPFTKGENATEDINIKDLEKLVKKKLKTVK